MVVIAFAYQPKATGVNSVESFQTGCHGDLHPQFLVPKLSMKKKQKAVKTGAVLPT